MIQNSQLILAGAGAVVVIGLCGLLAAGTLLAQARPHVAQAAPQRATAQPVPAAKRDTTATTDPANLAIGKAAPAFSLDAVDGGEFRTVRLEDFKGKWLVVLFYPLDFTFVCPTELCAYSDGVSEFRACGAEIVGVSIDSKFTHLAWTQRPRSEGGIDGLAFPLLADINK